MSYETEQYTEFEKIFKKIPKMTDEQAGWFAGFMVGRNDGNITYDDIYKILKHIADDLSDEEAHRLARAFAIKGGVPLVGHRL